MTLWLSDQATEVSRLYLVTTFFGTKDDFFEAPDSRARCPSRDRIKKDSGFGADGTRRTR